MSMAANSKIPLAHSDLEPVTSERLGRPFQHFAGLSSSGGIVLLLFTMIALIWANSPYGDYYHRLFHETYINLTVGESAGYGHGAHGAGHEAGHEAGGHAAAGYAAAGHGGEGEGVAGYADDGHHAAPDAHGAAAHADETHGPVGGGVLAYSLGHWINDALMAVFFLLVGLEIKREIVVGELASMKRAALPIAAAMGGMLLPAGVFAAIIVATGSGADAMRGWGVPMATDIAFALGILALLGSRVPNSLKIFLTSLAIVDDLGALLVIAIFYTDNIAWNMLGDAFLVLALLVTFSIMRVRSVIPYLVAGAVMWYFMLMSGVHSTIAGVLLAATIPVAGRVDAKRYLRSSRAALDVFEKNSKDGIQPNSSSEQRAAVMAVQENGRMALPLLHRMEHALHPWVAFLIIPVFALANAGLKIGGETPIAEAATDTLTLGVMFGLLIGKPLGILLFSFAAVKIGVADLPKGVSWKQILGVGFLGGIGFTMALFIANLAFRDNAAMLDLAKLGILGGSAISAIVGLALLLTSPSRPEPEPDQLGPEVAPH